MPSADARARDGTAATGPDRDRASANFELLGSAEGSAVLRELARARPDAGSELALAGRLRRDHPAELVTAALGQHELRERARHKFAGAGSMWFTRDGLEQASAEPVARHRAARFAGRSRVADLCCGIGGDLLALAAAPGVDEVLAVDRDPLHLRMALRNAAAHGVAARVRGWCGDVREADLTGLDAVFVDPARRAGGRRLRTGDGEPPLDWCVALAGRVPVVGVKAAPGLDRELVPPGWEVEFVAEGRDLKEAVLWSPAPGGIASRATVLPGGEQLLPDPGPPVAVREPGEFLLDPNPAVTRAGLVAELARAVSAWQIDPRIAFLSADRPPRTPFGRTLRVLDSGPWRERELPARLRAHGIGAVDIRRRGLAGDVDVLHRRLRASLTPGGRPAVLLMTRVHDRPWALVCAEV